MSFRMISNNFPHPYAMILDRRGRKYLLYEKTGKGKELKPKLDYKIEENICSVTLMSQQKKLASAGQMAVGGLIGAAFFGGLDGFLVGAGTEEVMEYTCALEVAPQWKLVVGLDEQAYADLTNMARSNVAAGKTLFSSATKNPAVPAPAVKANPAPKKKKLTINDMPKLKQFLDDGVITEEEFAAVKKKILGL